MTLRSHARGACVAATIIVCSPLVARGATPNEPSHVTVGVRLATRSFFFDASTPAGLTGTELEGDVGVRLAPHFHLYAFGELGVYDQRSDRISPGSAATSQAFGAGLRASVNPEGPWDFIVDLAIARRALTVPFGAGVDRFHGWEPLRFRVGPAFDVERRVRLDVMFGAALGRFVGGGHVETCAIVATCRDSLVVDGDSQSAVYYALDLSVGVHVAL